MFMRIKYLIIKIILWLWFSNATATEVILTVIKKGPPGKIVSDPVGIDCGTDCTESYDFGTSVLLTATSEIGSVVSNWISCFSQSVYVKEKCIVIMDKSKEVGVGFVNVATSEQVQKHLELAKDRINDAVTYNNKIISDKEAAIKREREKQAKVKADRKAALEQALLEREQVEKLRQQRLKDQPDRNIQQTTVIHEVVEVVHNVVKEDELFENESPPDPQQPDPQPRSSLTLPNSASPFFDSISR